MKRTYFLAAILCTLPFIFVACQEEDDNVTGNLEIIFKGKFGGEPLYMFGRSYDYQNDAKIKWQLFQSIFPIWS